MIALSQAERALRLVGAATTLREAINAPLPQAEQTKLQLMLEPVRQSLGEAAAEVLLAEGKILSMEQAIDEALQTA